MVCIITHASRGPQTSRSPAVSSAGKVTLEVLFGLRLNHPVNSTKDGIEILQEFEFEEGKMVEEETHL